MIAHCVECDETIELGSRPRVGLKVTCQNCGANLEVVNVDPIELDWVYDDDDEGEEWDYEDDELGDDDFDDEFDDDDDLDDFDDDDFDDDRSGGSWR